MAIQVAYLTYELFKEGNLANQDALGNPDPGAPARGRKGYEAWLATNVVTIHDIDYDMSQNIQVVVYE